METFRARAIVSAGGNDSERVPEQVFDVLTSREFCYLTKSQVSRYRERVVAIASLAVRRNEPIRFYYDLGGGYHASIHPGQEDLSFDVGLAELFVLSQIARFSAEVRRVYPPGVMFSLVIDNMCALLVNDIPIVRTLSYCTRLSALIREVGLADVVNVLVESQHASVADLGALQTTVVARNVSDALTRKQHDNVERFLGRLCDDAEALERTVRYRHVVDASERVLAPLIKGIRMTQRATDATICFRPFPGGASRIQCGQVVLTGSGSRTKRKFRPVLLTSGSRGYYNCRRYPFPGLLSSLIPWITYAEQLGQPR